MNIKKKYTFNPLTRYITKGISERIPAPIVTKLWAILDAFLGTKLAKDYLQVFVLKTTPTKIQIRHFQEEPAYEHEVSLEITRADDPHSVIDEEEIKIYIIDDEDHSTMLLAEEY